MPAFTMTPIASTERKRTPLESIPQDTKDTLEEALKEAPGERLQTEHGTKEAAEAFLVDARSYAQLRPETDGGKFAFAGNPTKAGYARWTVTPR
jgi:hypothetical protein